jgi:Flp pilus assembly protein TadD
MHHEVVKCPHCERKLQLPPEYMGMTVQCPTCQTAFVAGEAAAKPPAKPDGITTPGTPIPDPPVAAPVDPRDREEPTDDRARRRSRTLPPKPAAGSPWRTVAIVIGIIAAIAVGIGYFSMDRRPRPFGNFAKDFAVKDKRFFDEPQPFVELPDRPLAVEERQDHARTFFTRFAAIMQANNTTAEVARFDSAALLDSMFEHNLLPAGWKIDQGILLADVRNRIARINLYGGLWASWSLASVAQPNNNSLIVVTRHPLAPGAVHFRWWLKHDGQSWKIQDVERIDFGLRLSVWIAASIEPLPGLDGLQNPEVRSLRDGIDAVFSKQQHENGERILKQMQADRLPPRFAALRHMLIADLCERQKRFAEAISAGEAAEKFEADLPGADFLVGLAHNGLNQCEAALKRWQRLQPLLGDDPLVNYELGFALHGLRRFPEAAVNYRKTLDAEPQNDNAFLSLLNCLGPDVKNDDIGERFTRINDARARFENYALNRWRARDAKTLEILAEAMRRIDALHPEASFYLGLALAEQRQYEQGILGFHNALVFQAQEMRHEHYYREFATVLVAHDRGLLAYSRGKDRPHMFRALGEAMHASARTDDLQQLIDLHAKTHPNDAYLHLYKAVLHVRDDEFAQADAAFTKAFKLINDDGVRIRFRIDRVRARYHTGDVLGAYRDNTPAGQTFSQLLELCWHDKNGADLAKLIDAHVKVDAGDPQLARGRWRQKILEKRYDEASKIADRAAADRVPAGDPDLSSMESFLYDMIDARAAAEAYRHASNKERALEIIAADLSSNSAGTDLQAVVDEHRKQFPNDPQILMYDGQRAALKQDWAKANKAYAEGWKKLDDTKKVRWTNGVAYARAKAGDAVQAYHDLGRQPVHVRELARTLLQDKKIDLFEQLIEAHRPHRGGDSDFPAYEARLLLLRKKPAEAAAILTKHLSGLVLNEQQRIGDAFLADMAPFDVAVEAYRCLPDKRDAFSQMVWKYRVPERANELEKLIAEHAKNHPDDPRLLIERGELHLVRKEYVQAEKQFMLAKERDGFNTNGGRFGLIRARIKLGKAGETYRELGPSQMTFQDIANQCVAQKEGAALDSLLAAHRQAMPEARNLGAWDFEALWLKQDFEMVVKAIRANPDLLKNTLSRFKCEGYLVRSLVKLKRSNEAIDESTALNKRKFGPETLLAYAIASTGDVKRTIAFLEAPERQRFLINTCYHDEDLGPILRSEAYRAFQDRHPPPPPINNRPDDFFDD